MQTMQCPETQKQTGTRLSLLTLGSVLICAESVAGSTHVKIKKKSLSCGIKRKSGEWWEAERGGRKEERERE